MYFWTGLAEFPSTRALGDVFGELFLVPRIILALSPSPLP
jgi:hypothetical protein